MFIVDGHWEIEILHGNPREFYLPDPNGNPAVGDPPLGFETSSAAQQQVSCNAPPLSSPVAGVIAQQKLRI